MPASGNGLTMCCFSGKDVPVGTKLYTDDGNEQAFIASLRQLDFYSEIRHAGFVTAGQACDISRMVESKIEELIKHYFGE